MKNNSSLPQNAELFSDSFLVYLAQYITPEPILKDDWL